MILDIRKLAEEAGISMDLWNMGGASIAYADNVQGIPRTEFQAFADAIVEECAKVCDTQKIIHDPGHQFSAQSLPTVEASPLHAFAIRALKSKP